MRRERGTCLLALLVFVVANSVPASVHATSVKSAEGLIGIRDVRVFDGDHVLPRATVLIRDGRIVEIGPTAAIPAGTDVIDGTGQTLLPGLIDCHVHVWDASQLEQAAIFGVTTVLDMGCGDPKIGAELRKKAGEPGSSLSDLRFAGYAVTVPGGHCTEYGLIVPTVTQPGEVQAFVDARIKEGSDYIKIIYDDGSAYGMHTPTLSKATLKAAIQAAQKRKKLALIHIATSQDARDAIELGADGLAHLFVDRHPDATFGSLVASHKAFVVPTLSVLRSVSGSSAGPSILTDAQFSPYLSETAILGIKRTFPPSVSAKTIYSVAEETVRTLRAAGVPILAGTDAPNPGTTHGASLHSELELLVHAGLTSVEALASATSRPADRFGLVDRGRIQPGKRADLLLVRGDPTADISATRNIVAVWRAGARIDRNAYLARLEGEREESRRQAASPPPAGSESGLISDFENQEPSSKFGQGWAISTDAILGGKSSAEYKVTSGGAGGSKGSLLVSGDVAPGLSFAFAGIMFAAGERPMSAANLSSKKGLSFWAKGDGNNYRVMLFTLSGGEAPSPSRMFTAGPEWKEYTFDFSDFGGLDGHDLTGIAFLAGPKPGKIAFQLDDVRLR